MTPKLKKEIVRMLESQTRIRSLSLLDTTLNMNNMASLDTLHIQNVEQSMVAPILEIGPQLTEISVGGDISILLQLEKDRFPNIEKVTINNYPDIDPKKRAKATKRSTFESLVSLDDTYVDVPLDGDWTSERLKQYLCESFNSSMVRSITFRSTVSNPNFAPLVWPNCTADWSSLRSVQSTYPLSVVLDHIPTTLDHLHLTRVDMSGISIASIFRRLTSATVITIEEAINKPSFAANDFASCVDCCKNISFLVIDSAVALANGATGTQFVDELTRTCSNVADLRIRFNPIAGTLPPDLITSRLPKLTSMQFYANNFFGAVPIVHGSNVQYLDFSKNEFTSWSAPAPGTPAYNATSRLLFLFLSSNKLTQIPDNAALRRLANLNMLDLSNNPGLTGSMPQPWPTQAEVNSAPSGKLEMVLEVLNLDQCAFSGTLPPIPRGLFSTNQLVFSVGRNNFIGTIPSSWASFPFESISFAGNTRLTGTIPQFVTRPNVSRSDIYLYVSNTSIHGSLPNLTPYNRSSINIDTSCSYVDPCDHERNPKNIVALPDSQCVESLHSSASLCSRPGASPMLSNIQCSQVPSCPYIPFPCPLPSPEPVALWACNGSQWYSNPLGAAVPSIVVPSPVTIVGNFSATSVTFKGLSGAMITVTECAKVPQNLHVILTPQELDDLRKRGIKKYADLLVSTTCSLDASRSAISASSKTLKKCEKIKSLAIVKGNTLSASFQLDTSKCNTWWVVLSVVFASVALIVIVLLLIFNLNPTARNYLCPQRNAKAFRPAH